METRRPRRVPTKRAKWAQEILHAVLKRGSEEHSVPKQKRATTKKNDLGETRFGGLGRLLVLLWRSPFFGRSFWLLVLLVCLLPCLRVCRVLPGSGSCLFALFSVYGRRKTFRYPLPRVFITYYLFTNKNEVYAVLMELDETVRNCTFHLKVPSSSQVFSHGGMTVLTVPVFLLPKHVVSHFLHECVHDNSESRR